MLNRIIKFSLTNRVVVLLLTAVMIAAAVVAMMRTEVDIFPDLNAPTVVVMTEAPGYAPEEVEKAVTFPIETAVNGASGVRRVRSSSATGFSVVWVEFEWGTDIYRARQTVAEKLSAISGDMPEGVEAPVLGPQSSILGEIMIIGLTADSTSMMELRNMADKVIAPRILSLGGVSQVSVIGGDDKEFQIRLSSEKMRHYGVTLPQVLESVDGVNRNVSGGILYEYGNEYLVKGDISTDNTDDIANTVVAVNEGTPVTIADIATVATGPATPRLGLATVKNKQAVLLTVTKQPETGSIGLTEKIQAELEGLSHSMPKDVHIATDIFRQSDFIQTSVSNLQVSLFEGALFVIIVLFFFLMNMRTTLISVVALPLSVLLTVLALYCMGMTINTMTLGGIAIAIGSLVDDAIVDVENVYKRLKQNNELPPERRKKVIHIVFQASKEVRMPIFNSSLIIVASFLPLFFLSGIEGRMLIPLGISFIVALLASTIVALTVTPVLCSYLLGSKKAMAATNKEPWAARKLRSWYSGALRSAMGHQKPVLWGTGILLAVAIGVMFTLGRSFLPPFNEGSFTINVSGMPGISLDLSNEVASQAEKIILETPEVLTTARKTGRAELDEHSLGVNVSEIEAPYRLDKGRSRDEVVEDLRHRLSHLPGVAIELGQPISHRIDAMLSGTEAQIAVKLFGDDLETLYRTARQISEEMKEVDGVVDVNVEQLISRPQLEIRPKRDMLARYGIPMSEFARYVEVMLGGAAVSQVYQDGYPYNLTVRTDDASRGTRQAISELMIDGTDGPVPLSHVADIVTGEGPSTINRENAARRIVISANTHGRDLRGVVNEIQERVDEHVKLPEKYYVTYGGQFESEAAASRTLALASLGALLIIFMLLYLEYRNVAQPLIILINMPLAMIGGVFILALTGSELNIPAIIGFISLLGITTRNGMLLMSRYNALAKEGHSLEQRLYEGSSDRLLPIIMTALTSMLALIPLALRGHEPGNEIQSPLALVILGGLITSTALNIFVVPIIYYLVSKRKQS